MNLKHAVALSVLLLSTCAWACPDQSGELMDCHLTYLSQDTHYQLTINQEAQAAGTVYRYDIATVGATGIVTHTLRSSIADGKEYPLSSDSDSRSTTVTQCNGDQLVTINTTYKDSDNSILLTSETDSTKVDGVYKSQITIRFQDGRVIQESLVCR